MRAGLAIVVALCASSSGHAETTTIVTISPDGGVLRAAYTLPTPTENFAFESNNWRQRRDAWTPLGEGWTFDGENLRRSDRASFSTFELRLVPDTRFYDRRYVAVDRIGADGWALYLAALRAAEDPTELRLDEFPDNFVVRIGGETIAAPGASLSPGGEAENRLAYVGPARYVTEGPMTLIAGDEVPHWLRERLLADMSAVVWKLSERFDARPSTVPTLIVSYDAEWAGRGSKGGVLDDAVLTFALRGTALDESDDSLGDDMTNSAAHEAVHLWNGGVWQSAQNEEQSWLHEGAAEYLASRLWQDKESLRVESEQRLNDCVLRADRRPLDGSAGLVDGAPPYDCGFVLQLAAEAASVNASAGDAFDLWRAVFATADDNHRYTANAFLNEAAQRGGKTFTEVATQMLDTFDDLDPRVLAERLGLLGIDVGLRSFDARDGLTIRGLALMPLLASYCSGRYGFTTLGDRLVLDTGERCAEPLSGDPAVVTVNGLDLFAAPAEAHASIRAACASRGVVVFGTPTGDTLAPLRCEVMIAPLPLVFEVRALPSFPEP
jgi:hypothetical protein